MHLAHPRRRRRPAPTALGAEWSTVRGPAPLPRHPAVPLPLVGVDHRLLQAACRRGPPPAPPRSADSMTSERTLTRLPPDHPGDRRPVVGEGPVAASAVGPPPRRVGRVGVRDAFFPPRLAYISSASTTASPSGLRSSRSRAWAWSRCRSSSRCLRSQPSSRASCAVGSPGRRRGGSAAAGPGGRESPAGRSR